MKYCIVQLDFYKNRNTIKYSLFKSIFQKSVEAYAQRIGSDYNLVTYEADYNPSHNEKIKLYKNLLHEYSEYDRILYLDLDVFVRNNSPNIFDTIQGDHLSGCMAIHDRYLFGIDRYLRKFKGIRRETLKDFLIDFRPKLRDDQFVAVDPATRFYNRGGSDGRVRMLVMDRSFALKMLTLGPPDIREMKYRVPRDWEAE